MDRSDKGEHPLRETGEADVERLHMRIVERERREPEEAAEPLPVWLWILIVAFLIYGGYYMG